MSRGLVLLTLGLALGCAACRGLGTSKPRTDSDPATSARRVPVVAPAVVVDVCVGDEHSCLLDGSGVVACFGDNSSGQILPGGSRSYSAPVRVTGLPAAKQLRCSPTGGCVSSGQAALTCFGDTLGPSRAVSLPGVPEDFVLFRGGGCALLQDHRVACWPYPPGPVVLAAEAAGSTAQAIGRVAPDPVCFTSGAGAPVCFGANLFVPVPQGVRPPKDPQPEIHDLVRLDDFAGATQLLATETPCALFADHRVKCRPGALADAWNGTTANELVATNGSVACLRDSGGVRCAAPVLPDHTSAVQAGVPKDAARLSLGESHACAVTSGKATCWGRADRGQLGDGVEHPNATDGTPAVLPGAVAVMWPPRDKLSP